MKTVSLKELHQHTGKLARGAALEPVLITDRGEAIAVMGPPLIASSRQKLPRSFKLTETIKPSRRTESSRTVSQMRDER